MDSIGIRSSVQDVTECKMCEREASLLYRTWTSCVYILCAYCGYRYKEYLLIDRKREKETGEQFYKLTKNGERIWRFCERISHGAYGIYKVSGVVVCGGFSKPITQKNIEKFQKVIESPEIDRGKSYLLLFDPTTKELTAVIGKIPEEPPY
jgi:hypothetical protein